MSEWKSSGRVSAKQFLVVVASMFLLVLVGLGSLFSFSSSAPTTSHDYQISLLFTVSRHGARAPVSTYQTDPYINETFSPFGWGQLTEAGRLQQYEQGKWLRNRYNSFLGQSYSPKKLVVQSTDSDRTKMSALLMSTGLWPPQNNQKWSPEFPNWQPIPYNYQPLQKDTLLLMVDCPKYHEEREIVSNSPEIQSKLAEFDVEHFYPELSQLTGNEIKDPDDVQDIFSTLLAELNYGLKMPDWVTPALYERMKAITEWSYIENAYSQTLKKLKGGPLLTKILNDAKQKQDGQLPAETKMYMYLGHDSTIVNLLSALGVWTPQIPGYGIITIFEILQSKKTNELYVRILLRNEGETEATELKIPDCEKPCPLNQLLQMTNDIQLEQANIQEECAATNENFTPPPYGGP